MKKLLALTALLLAISTTAQAHILPDNNLDKDDRLDASFSGITKQQFTDIGNSVISQFTDAAKTHGATLILKPMWTNSQVNSSADQKGNKWYVNMYGGLARRPEITPDGLALVACHELGHHFSGYYFYSDTDWAAAEGQADYFATQVCARIIWGKDLAGNAAVRASVPAAIKTQCDAAWSAEADQNLCYRTGVAGQSLANLLAVLGKDGTPDPAKKDTSTVTETNVEHPASQCRLDTYLAGSQCTTAFDMTIIPGRNLAAGQNSLAAEMISAKYTCFDKVAGRPACWFRAQH